MASLKVVGIVLIIVGALALAYGGFTYTKQTDEARIGPIAVQVQEKRHVNIPLWGGMAVVVLGVILLVIPASGPRALP